MTHRSRRPKTEKIKHARPVSRSWLNAVHEREFRAAEYTLMHFEIEVDHQNLSKDEWIAIDLVKHRARLAAVRYMTKYTDTAPQEQTEVLDLDALNMAQDQSKRAAADILKELGF